MSCSKSFIEFVIDQLRLLDEVRVRPMMGEYLLYCNGVLVGGIYDDRLLIKKTETNKKFNLKEEIPYINAKPMFMIEDLDNEETLKEIIVATCEGLKK